jgi:serine/threonine protein kinase
VLSNERVIVMGVTPHAHEREGVDFLRTALPDSGQIRLWALVDLVEPQGRRYEIDALVLGTHALYVVEIKSHPGQVNGDAIDWTHTFPDGHRIVRENPLRLCALKARVLAGLLEQRMGSARPWVEPLVFLSHAGIDVRLSEGGKQSVVTRGNLVRAITHAEFSGASPKLKNRQIDKPTAQELTKTLHSLGIAPSKGQARLGELALGGLLEEGPGYQDRLATHERMSVLRRRVRSYLVPQSNTPERREQLRRAAEREARMLTVLSDHPGILKLVDYTADGPFAGPCVTFEHVEDARPLDAFLRAEPRLSFGLRVELIEKIASALAYCHKKSILHRALHPGAVLVRKTDDQLGLDVKIYDFQLASQQDGSTGTVHLSQLSHDRSLVYRAPELLEDPSRASVASDLFSLGAIAYLILTGQPPGADLADRNALLGKEGLSLAAARDDLSAPRNKGEMGSEGVSDEERRSLDELIRDATHPSPLQRSDDVTAWINLLLEAATKPSSGTSAADPLNASPNYQLTPEITVKSVLGSGSTAKVFRVQTPQGVAALKVALSEDLANRLKAEAAILERIRSSRVVGLRKVLTIGGRTALLLDDAGDTLADELAMLGPVSLDYGKRWGIDLLQALSDLEELGLQHRDIKPQNLAVSGADGRTRHLRIFDFSLSSTPPEQINAGTPVYRDPFLHERGAWDEAADRWSVAVTLHEMLTGVRPRWSAGSAAATEGGITIEAERLDAGVRGQLTAFFRKALARYVPARFSSAGDMLAAWSACFAEPTTTSPSVVPTAGAPPKTLPPAALVARVDEQTSIDALALSPAARNALDRAGVLTLGEVLRLPDNQLSALRRVGRATVQEILQLRAEHRSLSDSAVEDAPFLSDFRGRDSLLSSEHEVIFDIGLPAEALAALVDAGLVRLSEVAQAPARRVTRLLASFAGAEEQLRRWMLMNVGEGPPATIEAWLDGLMASRELDDRARAMLGLDPNLPGPFASVTALATKTGWNVEDIAASLTQARLVWRTHELAPLLLERILAAVVHLGGVAPGGRVAQMLALFLPHQPGTTESQARNNALTLVHLGAEILYAERNEERRSHPGADLLPLQARVQEHALWLAQSPELLDEAFSLGKLADELCKRDPLPSSEEVREALAAHAQAGTALAALPPERLVGLAADASQHAARSARLELYEKGLRGDRALRLCAGAFTGNSISAETIRRVVRARYPEAQLIARPELDRPLEDLGLFWSDTEQAYSRRTSFQESSTVASHQTPLPPVVRGPRQLPQDMERQEFEEQLQYFRERGQIRVVPVEPQNAENLARRLAQRLGTAPVSIEQELLHAMFSLAAQKKITESAILDADHKGLSGPHWPLLCRLAREASLTVLGRLLERPSPVLLVHPGLLARYQLDDFLDQLFRAHETRDNAPAILLINPGFPEHDRKVQHSPGTSLPLPLTHPGQLFLVPPSWWMESRRHA